MFILNRGQLHLPARYTCCTYTYKSEPRCFPAESTIVPQWNERQKRECCMTGFRFSRSNVQYPARKLGQFSSAVQYIYYTAVLFSTQDTVQFCLIWLPTSLITFSHTHTHTHKHITRRHYRLYFSANDAIELLIIWLPTTSKQNFQEEEKRFRRWWWWWGYQFPSRFCCCRVSAFIYSVKQLDEMMEKKERNKELKIKYLENHWIFIIIWNKNK